MPAVARVSPIANIGDPPVGRRVEVDDQVDAPAVGAVDEAPAEDHLPVTVGRAGLASREAEWGQDRIECRRNSVECGVGRRDRVRSEWHAPHRRIDASPTVASRPRPVIYVYTYAYMEPDPLLATNAEPGPPQRPARSRRRARALTRDEVLDAAVEIADRGDLDQLTMRGLADGLGVSAMSLYAHVADKDDILDAVLERRLRASGMPVPDLDWHEWMIELCDGLRRLLVESPALLDRYARRPVGIPAALDRIEATLAILREAGFGPDEAVAVFAAAHSYTLGFAALEAARRAPASMRSRRVGWSSDESRPGYWTAHFGSLDVARYPELVRCLPDLADLTAAPQFRLGLEALLVGLDARLRARR